MAIKSTFGVALALAVTFAAARYPAGQATADAGSGQDAAPSQWRTDAPSPEAPPKIGDCTAYTKSDDPDNSLKDPDRGVAEHMLEGFLGKYSDASGASGGVRYVVALAPDPVHTNLSLEFDREMEVVQQAAQDEGFTYDSSWLPWRSAGSNYPLLRDQEIAAALARGRESCPGLLLFRKSNADNSDTPNGLVVFVVGEQPTGGLNQAQWKMAVNFVATAERLATPENCPKPSQGAALRVLGPSFSGSLASLYSGLRREFPAFGCVVILSGDVSASSPIHWFEKQLKELSRPVAFGTFQENDELQMDRFVRYLYDQGTDASELAILSEDETAYTEPPIESGRGSPLGIDGCREGHCPLRLSYPRDISRLRTAYSEQAIFASSHVDASQIHSVLRFAGHGDQGPSVFDTIPSFSGFMTSISQESALYGIANQLRVHHSRYLLLRCTNPQDFLFLVRFFHRNYPEARIIIMGSDLLIPREVDTTEFRGVLALSNYPLLPSRQKWSPPDGNYSKEETYRIFQSHTTQGTYNAARTLFSSLQVPTDSHNQPLSISVNQVSREYLDPSLVLEGQFPNHLPTWLTVVGRDGYWPVAVLNDPSTPNGNVLGVGSSPPTTTIVQLTCASGPYPTRLGTVPAMPLPWFVCVGFAGLLLMYQAYGISNSRDKSPAGLLSIFTICKNEDGVVTKRPGLLMGLNTALAFTILLELMSARLSLVLLYGPMDKGLDKLFLIISLAILVEGFMAFQLWKYKWTACFTFVAVSTFMAAISFWPLVSANPSRVQPLYYRMVHLTSGVSPLLPILCLLVGLYLWSWQALAANIMLSYDRPKLPELNSHMAIGNEADSALAEAADPISFKAVALPCLLILTVAVLYFGRLHMTLLSLEGQWFNFWFHLGLALAFALTVAEVWRLFFTWVKMKSLLNALNELPLRRTFAKLRAVGSDSLWSVSGNVHRVQHKFFTQQLDAVARLSNLRWNCSESIDQAAACGQVFAKRFTASSKSNAAWRCLMGSDSAKVRQLFARAVAEAWNAILVPGWRTETVSLNMETNSASLDGRERNIDLPLSPSLEVRTAEEFICLYYIAYIQVFLARMRTMTFSMGFLFVSVCAAIVFYPFVPRTQVTAWMLADLVLIAGVVIYVYAGMERDETLSHITNTKAGSLGTEFWLRTATFLVGPVIGLLATQFPALAESILSWLPGLTH